MRQRESYAMPLIRVNTLFWSFSTESYATTLTVAESGLYVLARSIFETYPQGIVTTLGKNIERLRLGAGHTNAAKFARSIGITAATLNDWESGRYSNLRLDSLLRIARGIPCTMDELLAGVDETYDNFRARADMTHENNPAGVTFSVPVDGVSSEPARTKVIRDALPEEPIDAEATPIRSPLVIAVALTEQAADFRTRADTFTRLADELERSLVAATFPRARPAPALKSPTTTASRRTSGRGHGGGR